MIVIVSRIYNWYDSQIMFSTPSPFLITPMKNANQWIKDFLCHAPCGAGKEPNVRSRRRYVTRNPKVTIVSSPGTDTFNWGQISWWGINLDCHYLQHLPHFSIEISVGPSTWFPSPSLHPWFSQKNSVQWADSGYESEERPCIIWSQTSLITSQVERVTAR